MSYQVNKGINRPPEFKGLKGQYIFYLIGGLVLLFVLSTLLYLLDMNVYLWTFCTLFSGGLLIYVIARLNARYGENGLMKLYATLVRPKAVLNRGHWIKALRRKGGK